jgi:hypothetical protein
MIHVAKRIMRLIETLTHYFSATPRKGWEADNAKQSAKTVAARRTDFAFYGYPK